MELAEMSKMITEFGIMIVICSIFLYTAVRLINMFLKSLDNRLRDKKHDELIDVRTSVNEKVQSLIDQFLEDHNNSRIHVVEFSNSVVSVAYLPFKYMTCTYEVYKVGKPSTASKIDHMSTSLFTAFFSKLYNADYLILDSKSPDPSLGRAIYDILDASGEHKGLYVILRTGKGKALGYLTVRDDEFDKIEIEEVQVLASKLSALLGVADK